MPPSTQRSTARSSARSSSPEVRVDGEIISPERVERVRQASWRMMAQAAVAPLPTSQPLTLNASATYYSQTWCPTGYKPSTTELEKRIAYLNMHREANAVAKREVQAEEKAYRKEMREKQRKNAPKRANGEPLW